MKKTPLKEVKSHALETAQRLIDYESYGQSEARALSALNRRCSGWEKDELRHWLNKAILLHHDCLLFVEQHASEMYQRYKDKKQLRFKDIEASFFEKNKMFSADLINHHMGFIFYYHHLR